MVKDVFDATKTLQLAVGRVELQKDVSRNPTFMKSFFLITCLRDTKSGETYGGVMMGEKTRNLRLMLRAIRILPKEFYVN
jgi:hypothetical protein